MSICRGILIMYIDLEVIILDQIRYYYICLRTGCRLTNLTGGGKERVPLYAWKNFAESNFEDHSGMTEQSYPISTGSIPIFWLSSFDLFCLITLIFL